MLGAALAAYLVLTAPPLGAASLRLTIERAGDRASEFAGRTCKRDKHCVRSGVVNCRRESRNVVFCRVFDERRTTIQGRYRCTRLARLTLDPRSRRVPVTGLGDWQC
jgi:hypothetical protein